MDIVPVFGLYGGFQPVEEVAIAVKESVRFLVQPGIERDRARSAVIEALHIVERLGSIVADDPAPHRGGGVGEIVKISELFVEPSLGEGVGHDEVIKAVDVLFERGVALGGREGLDQHIEVRVTLGIHAVERQAHRIGTHHGKLAALADTVFAVDVKFIEVFACERGTKRVDSRDVRLAEQRLLAGESRVGGVLADALGQSVIEANSQLRRRSAGIGDDQQAVDVNASLGIGIGDHTDDALDKYGRFAGACRRGNDDRAAARGDRAELVIRPLSGLSHRCPPLPKADRTAPPLINACPRDRARRHP